jgi:type VI secretion system protein VasD
MRYSSTTKNKKAFQTYPTNTKFMFFLKAALPLRHLLMLITIAPLTGCAGVSAVSTVAQVANLALGAVGISKPADPNATNNMPLAIQASNDLNTDDRNRAFSIVVRIYQLKQSSAFQQAFYEIFLDPQKEQATFGQDVIAMKEITLIPGQKFVNTEKISVSADYIGIVALFHAPAAARWKLTFPAKDLNKTGISLGVSACSMTVAAGTTLEYSAATRSALKTPVTCS